MSVSRIPFNRVDLADGEEAAVLAALRSGSLAGDGPFNRRCGRRLEELTGTARALLTPSCTAALEMAAMLLELEPGDEVILPSFTFVTTATAFCLRGARPVFVDIRPDTLNLDEQAVAAAVTDRTRAVVVVHYGGVACEMDAIAAVAHRHGLALVEDAANGFLGTYRGRWLGTIGDLGCFSFHQTKTFTTGEGGAVFVNRPDLVARAEIIRDKGTDRARFQRGEVDEYTWMDIGSSYAPSEFVGSLLLAQLDARAGILARRRHIFEAYRRGLEPLVERGLVETIRVPADRTTNYQMFWLLVRDADERCRLLAHLDALGIGAAFHYVPLHNARYARSLGIDVRLPVTERQAARLVRLPFYTMMTEPEQHRVIDALHAFWNCAATAGPDRRESDGSPGVSAAAARSWRRSGRSRRDWP